MSKRAAEELKSGTLSLKSGERPEKAVEGDEVGEFEDEFEDEFESEDEIFEAGVDGRPDEEREAEEKAGELRRCLVNIRGVLMVKYRCYGRGPADIHSGEK
jgi:hypothetical protein